MPPPPSASSASADEGSPRSEAPEGTARDGSTAFGHALRQPQIQTRAWRRTRLGVADLGRLLMDAGKAWVDDRAASMGASLAYYTLFSLAPLLLIVMAVAGLWLGADAARGEIYEQLRSLFGPTGGTAVQALLESTQVTSDGIVATVTGVSLMLLGATTVFAELQAILDRIWQAPPRRSTGVWRLLRARVLSFGLILGLGFLLVVSLLLNAAIAALQRWWLPRLSTDAWVLVLADVLNATIGFALLALLFAMIYKLLPRVRIAWQDVWFGAVVTAALLSLGRVAIGLYVGHSAVGSGFGAAGSLVVVLVWVYYSAQIFLFGAEFTWVYAHRHGSRRHLPAQRSATVDGLARPLK